MKTGSSFTGNFKSNYSVKKKLAQQKGDQVDAIAEHAAGKNELNSISPAFV